VLVEVYLVLLELLVHLVEDIIIFQVVEEVVVEIQALLQDQVVQVEVGLVHGQQALQDLEQLILVVEAVVVDIHDLLMLLGQVEAVVAE
jgi:dTDP-4-dehydrorhamnose 3,5-epimerase-like enzyme